MCATSWAVGPLRWAVVASPTARRTAIGTNEGAVPEAAPVLRRADSGAETRGAKGSKAPLAGL